MCMITPGEAAVQKESSVRGTRASERFRTSPSGLVLLVIIVTPRTYVENTVDLRMKESGLSGEDRSRGAAGITPGPGPDMSLNSQ